MKPSLGLKVSQHLALTPQLQQSIRLLQLSTLELAQETEQMLLDNPFLEVEQDSLGHEESLQLDRAERQSDDLYAINSVAVSADSTAEFSLNDTQKTASEASIEPENPDFEPETGAEHFADWSGEGSHEFEADDKEWGNEAGATLSASVASSGMQGDDDFDPASNSALHSSLQDFLHAQARHLRLSEADRAALMVLIESLNEDGYLDADFEDLASSLGAQSLEEVEEAIVHFNIALKLLQHLEPTGVGARNLSECMLLQLRQLPPAENLALAKRILEQPLDFLARRDWRKLSVLCGASVEQLKSALPLITALEPKPGRAFAQVERLIVTPDVIVRARQQRGQSIFVAQLNPDVMPKLAVSERYADVLKAYKKDEAAQNLQGKLQEARWYIKNVQQRFDTILRVSQAIIERQTAFFKHGAVAMRPLVLREIADEIGMHESTVSRVTTAKYMSTPWGTFELKYFFGSGLATEAGAQASSTAVRELIRQFIEAENKAKPLSDQAIMEMLAEQGIECARRTVAKYREAMRIPVTSLRRAL